MQRSAVIFAVLSILLVCFIWGQSMLPREVSAQESTSLMVWLKPLLDPGGRIAAEEFHHNLRKAAHFAEYAALGFCVCGFFLQLDWKKQRGARVPAAIASCAVAAAVDEMIQLFSDGRGPMLSDVILDSCGAVFGLCVFLLLRRLLARGQNHSRVSD